VFLPLIVALFVGLLASLTMMWTGLFPRAAELIAAMRQAATASGVSPFSLITLNRNESGGLRSLRRL
jgi:hypothetical protein